MLTYDQGRPYLSSTKLSWSWPSFSQRRDAWYKSLGTPDDPAFLTKLAASGFVGVWIDRYGYSSSELAALEGKLAARLGPPLVGGLAARYAYFDLSPLRSGSQLSEADRYRLLHPLLLTYERGFYAEEQQGERRHRWSQRSSIVRVRNDGETTRSTTFQAIVQAGEAGTLRMMLGTRQPDAIPFSAGESKPVSLSLTIPPSSSVDLTLAFDGPQFAAPGDARTLYFAVINPGIEER
jgi:hypothetical protein